MRTKRLKATVPFEKKGQFITPVGIATDKADAKTRAKEARKLRNAETAAGRTRLSTTVGLLPPDATAGAPGEKQAKGHATVKPEERSVVVSRELETEHPVVRQYMAHQGFPEATDIQRQCWRPACEGLDIVAQVSPMSLSCEQHDKGICCSQSPCYLLLATALLLVLLGSCGHRHRSALFHGLDQ
jgi:hypothetical protein